LLQIYSPVRLNGTNQIIAVAELYQKVDALQADINTAQWHTWLAVGLAMLLIYLALVAFGPLAQQYHRAPGNGIDSASAAF